MDSLDEVIAMEDRVTTRIAQLLQQHISLQDARALRADDMVREAGAQRVDDGACDMGSKGSLQCKRA